MKIQNNVSAGKISAPSKTGLLQNLKAGDVLQGTVKQLYPNHRAAVQMQGQQVIAQLEASLSVGGRYFFQVAANEGTVPELKVMTGDQHNGQLMAQQLLQQLGIKENKLSVQLVNALSKEQIPMQRSDLMQAIQYIQENKITSKQALPILTQLMKMRIPVTQGSFQALHALHQNSIGGSMASLDRSLTAGQQPMLQTHLEHVLRGFPSEQSAVRALLTADAQAEKPVLFPLLQNLDIVSKNVDKQRWSNILQQWTPNPSQTTSNPTTSVLPFTADFESVKEQLQSMLGNQKQLMAEARALHGALMQGNNTATLSKTHAAALFPQYFENHAQVTQENESNVRALLEAVMEPKNFQALERLMHIWTASNENNRHRPNEQFLQQMRWVLRDAGLHVESSLKTNEPDATQFKHLLLEMVQNNSSGIGRENAQQLLHFLNGMQINSMHDAGYSMQANLQIPSQKLGLSKDIDLQFEGKKTADGSIDPEHCRIIFDLEMHRMKETIVDLQVHQKAVAITIYNDQASTPVLADKLRPDLQAELEKIGYQVTSITCKPYTERNNQQIRPETAADEKAAQRKVDFRV